MDSQDRSPPSYPRTWTLLLAFALVYLSWGTTYYVIRLGVHTYHLPPAMFGGVRVSLAGLVLLGFLGFRGQRLRLSRGELLWAGLCGFILFVGGNGLITAAMDRVPSGVASVLVATTPLWIALIEPFCPGGDRMSPRGWVGLGLGLAGMLVLLAPCLTEEGALPLDFSPLMVLGSAASWALGSVVLRYGRKPQGSHLVTAAYQMSLGGAGLALIGLALGEGSRLSRDLVTPVTLEIFAYLLIVGSLMGFVAYNWLLGHVRASLVGTYAYVNPLVAILVSWIMGDEPLTGWILGGMVIILTGVALVRGSGIPARALSEDDEGGMEVVALAPPVDGEKAVPQADHIFSVSLPPMGRK